MRRHRRCLTFEMITAVQAAITASWLLAVPSPGMAWSAPGGHGAV